MFCPIILRFISWSALGNLDNSSGGTHLLPRRCTADVDDTFIRKLFELIPLFLWFCRFDLKNALFRSVCWFYG